VKKLDFMKLLLIPTLIFAGTTAQADPKPKPSAALSAQVVANTYAGRMQVWKSCKGGVYFGGNWEAVAYCSKNKNSVGVGTWNTKGRQGLLSNNMAFCKRWPAVNQGPRW
jgi:hypothetical protein